MRTVKKKVHYCDFCRKHGMSMPAMAKHEAHCTMNPNRSCRWKFYGREHKPLPTRLLVADLHTRSPLSEDDIEWLRGMVSGCPACMLAALRQSGLQYHFTPNHHHAVLWDYGKEVERFRDEERRADEGDQW